MLFGQDFRLDFLPIPVLILSVSSQRRTAAADAGMLAMVRIKVAWYTSVPFAGISRPARLLKTELLH